MKMNTILVAFFTLLLMPGFNSKAEVVSGNEKNKLQNISNPATLNTERFDHIISGFVYKNSQGNPFEGVVIDFLPDGGSAITDADGFYSKAIPRGSTVTAVPSYCDGFNTFTPAEILYENILFDFEDQNYIINFSETFTISGKFYDSNTGDPLANQNIDLGSGISVNTNALGEYTLEFDPCWQGTLDPDIDYYYFTPDVRDYASLTSNQVNQDFEATYFNNPIPPGWEYPNTGTVHIMSVFASSGPNICGIDLQPGDYIGVFYINDEGGETCGGAGMWTGTENVALIAQGDDNYTPEKDGFSWGEQMIWYVYPYSLDQEMYPAEPEYKSGLGLTTNNKWYPSGLSIIDELNAYHKNDIVIPQGWSGLSSYTEPSSIILTTVMSPIINELVIIQDMEKMYYPEAGINNMFIWTDNKGYKIKLTDQAILPMSGCPSADKTITLKATWNIIPVMSKCNVLLTDVFNPIMDKVIVIKEIAGTRIFWPDLGIQTLQILEPGRAYFVGVSQNTSITYGDCSFKSNLIPELQQDVNLTPWNSPIKTGSTHTFALPVQATGIMDNGDYLGAFTQDGICAGLVQVNDFNENTALTVFGNDVSTAEKDGFAEGETIRFKLYRTETGEVVDLTATFDESMPVSNGSFTDNGLSVIASLKYSSTGIISQGTTEVLLYPNPTDGKVEFTTQSVGKYAITIQNMNGQLILSENHIGNAQFDLSGLSKGIYMVKIEGDDFSTIEKLVLK